MSQSERAREKSRFEADLHAVKERGNFIQAKATHVQMSNINRMLQRKERHRQRVCESKIGEECVAFRYFGMQAGHCFPSVIMHPPNNCLHPSICDTLTRRSLCRLAVAHTCLRCVTKWCRCFSSRYCTSKDGRRRRTCQPGAFLPWTGDGRPVTSSCCHIPAR